jgi:DNA-binding MarR family transcriptional regulator
MNPSDLKQSELKPFAISIEADADGCLFERTARKMVEAATPAQRPALEALAALRMASQRMHLQMERWAELHGLSEGRMQVLFRLRKAPEQSIAMAELAESMNVSPRNITGLVDNLERDGLVERVPDPSDRRSVLAKLTEKGMQKVESVWHDGLNLQVPLTQEFTKDELVQLRHMCLRLVQRINELGRTHS